MKLVYCFFKTFATILKVICKIFNFVINLKYEQRDMRSNLRI